jgi:hypothetical protein
MALAVHFCGPRGLANHVELEWTGEGAVIGALPYPRSLPAQHNGERASIISGLVICSDFRYWHKADIPAYPGLCPLSGVKRT